MQEIFEKIIENLKQESIIVDNEAGNRAVEIIEQAASEYNNDWIPVSSGRLPKEHEDVEVTVEEINEVGEKQYYNARSWLQDDRWVIKRNPYNPTVIAWRYPIAPYQPKEE